MEHNDILPGSLALSYSRSSKLALSLGAKSLIGLQIFYFKVATELPLEQLDLLHSLLDYGTPPDRSNPHVQQLVDNVKASTNRALGTSAVFFSIPRKGSISPWSSQATSIAHQRGITGLDRVERGIAYLVEYREPPSQAQIDHAKSLLHDRMTQEVISDLSFASFESHVAAPVRTFAVCGGDVNQAHETLNQANNEVGLALDGSEISYLVDVYHNTLRRDPTDVELYMFAQVNSEHCRHKQFNAKWKINGSVQERTLFQWIRRTHQRNPQHVLSAYSDNAAVFEGSPSLNFAPQVLTNLWTQIKEPVHYLGKVETHNHPTAVSPYPGAATGSGGEIRDEGSVGQGSKPKAGLCGFCVSDLLIPGHRQAWETDVGKPPHISSSLDIMIEAPLGSSDYNNEFGRPCLISDFHTLLQNVNVRGNQTEMRGYHKPVMVAGGVGTVRPRNAMKQQGMVKPGDYLIVIGGPAMRIGLGGGAASSVQSGQGNQQLDFDSVQRGNAEVQRRVQEVINSCADESINPISSIHDVGAGGLSNALTELAHDNGLGAECELREIESADSGMSALEIWCCEAQERYVVAVSAGRLVRFKEIAERERCGYSIVGKTTGTNSNDDTQLVLTDRNAESGDSWDTCYTPIDLSMQTLFGKPPQISRDVQTRKPLLASFDNSLYSYIPDDPGPLYEAVSRVLHLPSASSRSFMITIGDRSVGGLVVRDQMVGPWQIPVANVGVTATALEKGIKTGEAIATGMRPSLALISPSASARMAVAECLMKLSAADLSDRLNRVHLSANWMAACNHEGEGAALYEAVQSLSEFCQRMGLCIPVGKDSMSMKMTWKDTETSENKAVTAPLTLYVTGFGLVRNISTTFTPQLKRLEDVGEETLLLFVDLSIIEARGGQWGTKAMGGSGLAQTFSQLGDEAPDIRDEGLLKDYFDAMEQLHEASDLVLAHHTRSSGGLLRTLCEMMFAGRCGLEVGLDSICLSSSWASIISGLFNEELGAVFQVRKRDEIRFRRCFATCGPPDGLIKRIGRVPNASNQDLTILHGTQIVYSRSRADLQQDWASTSYAIQRMRDNPECADIEYNSIRKDRDQGLQYRLSFDHKEDLLAKNRSWLRTVRSPFTDQPKVAVLREQGTNGAAEMAFAFHSAGFVCKDVHMTDLEAGRTSLSEFVGLAACGGFSYGDVLGAGRGWASGVLMKESMRNQFKEFFERPNTFTLGVCNGCQFLTHLKQIIPGAEGWPTFETNVSERYEARVSMVKISDYRKKPSVFLNGMEGSIIPVATAHAEGRATFRVSKDDSKVSSATTDKIQAQSLISEGTVPFRYADTFLEATEKYPLNPNGSPLGIAGVRNADGRVLALMPHPERTIIKDCCSWAPKAQSDQWGDFGPWIRLFQSARCWVG